MYCEAPKEYLLPPIIFTDLVTLSLEISGFKQMQRSVEFDSTNI
jgi:hypothetical protein